MGGYGAATPWSESSVKGCKKFLDRVAGLTDILSEESVSDELEMKLHRTIKKVSGDIENLKFNTAIASRYLDLLKANYPESQWTALPGRNTSSCLTRQMPAT